MVPTFFFIYLVKPTKYAINHATHDVIILSKMEYMFQKCLCLMYCSLSRVKKDSYCKSTNYTGVNLQISSIFKSASNSLRFGTPVCDNDGYTSLSPYVIAMFIGSIFQITWCYLPNLVLLMSVLLVSMGLDTCEL